MILVTVAILIVPSSVLQVSHAQSDLANTVLAVHNRERAAVGSEPLVWSDELAAEAKTWAEHIATTGVFAHETAIFPAKGENIAGFITDVSEPEGGLSKWVAEKEDWNGAPVTDENLYPIGHYVQMVSTASKGVGCGTAPPVAGKLGYSILVCRYDRSLFPQEPYIPSFMSQPAQAIGEDAGVPPADQAIGEDAGVPPADQAVGNDGGGGGDDGGGGDGGDDGGGGDGDGN
jgi:uncharacterized membrane protein YgcG